MSESSESYEEPRVTVLGVLSDMTQKQGIYFDYGYAVSGSPTPPAPGTPGSGLS